MRYFLLQVLVAIVVNGVWAMTCLAEELPADFFPILPWELPPVATTQFSDARSGLASLAECGFTVAAFVRPQHLAECRRLGLKALVAPARWERKWRELSDEQIDSLIKKLVGESAAAGDDTIIGYFLTDEPSARDFGALAKGVAAVKKYAPGKLAYINLLPDYATIGAKDLSQLGTESYTDYLERFAGEVRPPFLSYDNYRVQFSGDLKDAKLAASYYNNLLEVRRVALKYKLPFWNIVSSNEIRPHTPVPSPANLLFQAYTTLAAGGQGLTWFKYYEGGYHYAPISKSGNRAASWSYLKMVNDQVKVLGPIMRRLKSTGVCVVAPPPISTQPQLPESVESVHSATPVMVGEFANPAGKVYVMIVNLSLEQSTKFTLKMRRGGTLHHISPVDGSAVAMEKDNSMWVAAGAGVLVRVD